MTEKYNHTITMVPLTMIVTALIVRTKHISNFQVACAACHFLSESHILTVTIMTMFNVMICYPRMKVLVCCDQVL